MVDQKGMASLVSPSNGTDLITVFIYNVYYSHELDSLDSQWIIIFQKCWDEFQERLPTLTSTIVAACSRKDQEKMKTKSRQSITPGITTTIGKCLGIYSKKLSAIKSYYGLMVSNSGITDAGLDRLAHLNDSIVPTTVGSKMCDMGKRVDVLQESNFHPF